MKIIDQLQKAGIPCEEYKRGPMGTNVFAIAKSQKGDKLRVWQPEHVDVTVIADKRKNQAVLQVNEKPRCVRVTYVIYVNPDKYFQAESKLDFVKPLLKNLSFRGSMSFSDVWIPNCASFTPESVTHGSSGFNKLKLDIRGVARTRSSKQTFLVGVDERKTFVSVLRQRVNSVTEAHKELRPKVSSRALRQGEWFFDPVPKHKAVEVMSALVKERQNQKNALVRRKLEGQSSHEAILWNYGGERYAIGIVKDRRSGYHDSLELNIPHRVVRNNERKIDQNVRMFD